MADNAAMETEPIKAAPPKRKRRWFQFRLRTMLIFTLICAVGSAWVAHRMEQKRREREAIEAIGKLGGSVWYDYQRVAGGEPPGPAWLRKLFGEDFFSEVDGVLLDESDVTVAGLLNVKRWARLGGLTLWEGSITDAGLANVKGLAHLRVLSLWEGSITDAGLANVRGLAQLQRLDLTGTQVTDAGLANLKGLTQLQELDLKRTKVTDAGANELQKSLPNCQIVR